MQAVLLQTLILPVASLVAKQYAGGPHASSTTTDTCHACCVARGQAAKACCVVLEGIRVTSLVPHRVLPCTMWEINTSCSSHVTWRPVVSASFGGLFLSPNPYRVSELQCTTCKVSVVHRATCMLYETFDILILQIDRSSLLLRCHADATSHPFLSRLLCPPSGPSYSSSCLPVSLTLRAPA